MKTIRIFISSPGDVAEERDRARQVVEGLRRRYARHFNLVPVLWEELPLQADMSFQQGIDLMLSQDAGVDIAVFILWSRLGSPVGPLVKKADGGSYRSGTEREFDLMLSARKQSTAATGIGRPRVLLYTRRDETSFEERLRGKSTNEKVELIQQKTRVESFIAEEFQDAETSTNVRAYHSFDRPVTFSQRLREHLTILLDELNGGGFSEAVWDTEKQGPPYLGLEAFQPRHADVFFGREDEILEIRHILREQARNGCAFVLLSGASGSGKSSLARAGLLPQIVENEIDEQVSAWRTLVVAPFQLAPDPIAAFVQQLAGDGALPELQSANTSLNDIAVALRRSPQDAYTLCLKPALSRASKQAGGGVRLLLILDQLEEFFTSTAVAAESRRQFLDIIEVLARSGSVWIIATARSDFNPQLQTEPALVRLKTGLGTADVMAPAADALRRLIEEPARLAGVLFEQQNGHPLSDRILRDSIGRPDALPLLEYALDQLFKEITAQKQLTFAAYEKMGGVEGALGQKAEEEFVKLPPEAQARFEDVMNTLVTVDADTESQPIARTTPLSHVTDTEAKRTLVEALIDVRLLTADKEHGTPVVRVAHEALLRRWERLVQWIAANREYLRLRARVEQSRARWEQAGRDKSLLLAAGLPLEEGRELLTTAPYLLESRSRSFVAISIAHYEAVRLRQRRLRSAVMAALMTLAVLAMCGAVAGWLGMKRANEKAELAEQKTNEVLAAQDLARARLAQAEKARDAAQNLITKVILDLRDKLSAIGKNAILEDIAAAAEEYYEKLPPELASETTMRHRVLLVQNRAMIALAKCDDQAAEILSKRVLTIAQELSAKYPSEAKFYDDQIQSHGLLAYLYFGQYRYAEADAAVDKILRIGKNSPPNTVTALSAKLQGGALRLYFQARGYGSSVASLQFLEECTTTANQLRSQIGETVETRFVDGALKATRGYLMARLGQTDGAMKLFDEADTVFKEIVEKTQGHPWAFQFMFAARQKAIVLLRDIAERTKNETLLAESDRRQELYMHEMEKLAEHEPTRLESWWKLAMAYDDWASIEWRRKNFASELQFRENALTAVERCAQPRYNRIAIRQTRGWIYIRLIASLNSNRPPGWKKRCFELVDKTITIILTPANAPGWTEGCLNEFRELLQRRIEIARGDDPEVPSWAPSEFRISVERRITTAFPNQDVPSLAQRSAFMRSLALALLNTGNFEEARSQLAHAEDQLTQFQQEIGHSIPEFKDEIRLIGELQRKLPALK